MNNLKLKLEERLQELVRAEEETVAQLWAIRGAMQELETITLPMIAEAEDENADNPETTGE